MPRSAGQLYEEHTNLLLGKGAQSQLVYSAHFNLSTTLRSLQMVGINPLILWSES